MRCQKGDSHGNRDAVRRNRNRVWDLFQFIGALDDR